MVEALCMRKMHIFVFQHLFSTKNDSIQYKEWFYNDKAVKGDDY